MTQKSGFGVWHSYARANDDVRHHLIERGWFGQGSQDHPMDQSVSAAEAQYQQDYEQWDRLESADNRGEPGSTEQLEHADRRADVYGHQQSNDLYNAQGHEMNPPPELEQDR